MAAGVHAKLGPKCSLQLKPLDLQYYVQQK